MVSNIETSTRLLFSDKERSRDSLGSLTRKGNYQDRVLSPTAHSRSLNMRTYIRTYYDNKKHERGEKGYTQDCETRSSYYDKFPSALWPLKFLCYLSNTFLGCWTVYVEYERPQECNINQCIHKVIFVVTKPLQIYDNVNVHHV